VGGPAITEITFLAERGRDLRGGEYCVYLIVEGIKGCSRKKVSLMWENRGTKILGSEIKKKHRSAYEQGIVH